MGIPSKVEEMERETEELLKKLQEESESSSNEETNEVENETNQEAPLTEKVFAPKKSNEDWEHKYNVLKGKYDAEVPALSAQVKTLMAQVETLTAKLQELSTSTNKITEEVPEYDDLDEFIEQYPDIYNAIEKVVEKKYLEKIKHLEDKINSTAKVTDSISQSQFFSGLSKLVPDWEAINTSKDFSDWVDEVEGFSGLTKRELLLARFKNLDVNGVAYFFNRYKQERGLAKNNLDNIITPEPSKSKSGVSQTKNYKITDINDLNRQIREALAHRDYKKADELEKRIDEILLNFKT